MANQITGDFWITMDPYQGLRDTHSLVRGFQNQIHWQGNLIDSNLLEKGFKQNKFIHLKECFRMPLTSIQHLDKEKILPIKDLPRAQDVKSWGVVVEDMSLPASYTVQWLAEQLADRLCKKVMLRGIHPGHCSVLYNHTAEDDLFPQDQGGLPIFLQMVNSSLRTIPVTRQASHVLQLTQNIMESVLYSCNCNSQDTSTTPLTVYVQLMAPSSAEETVEYKMERHSEVILNLNNSIILDFSSEPD